MNEIDLKNKKIAIVYDRVNKFGGAERVLLTLHEMFPDAPLYTSIYDPKNTPWANVFPKIYTSFLQKIPILKNHHELLGWLMPLAFEKFDFSMYDIVISVTSEAAKGIITGTNTLHICYCLTPTRYLWSASKFYLETPPKIFKIFPFYKIISWPFLAYAKWWDKVGSQRPDKYISISTEVQKRIAKYYLRKSDVIFPPVNIPEVATVNHSRGGIYYFIHGRFEPYKRLDLVIDVFNELKLPLVVSGSGSEFKKFKNKVKSNIKFIYKQTDEELWKLYANAKAFLMPQEEDFGITAVEAQSYGVPVIAYVKGGALDTVVPNRTGVFFDTQSKESLKQAIAKFDILSFNSRYLKAHARKFSDDRFKGEFISLLIKILNKI